MCSIENDSYQDRQTIRHDSKWIFLDQERTLEEHQHAQELNAYRRLHQRPENAREWDLNDPNRWKSQPPARISDQDPRLGPSSGQIFAGEDLRAPSRKKAQQEQMRNALHLQVMRMWIRGYMGMQISFRIKRKWPRMNKSVLSTGYMIVNR